MVGTNDGEFAAHELIQKATQDPVFRQELLADPRKILSRELGREIPGEVTFQVIELDARAIPLVLPPLAGSGDELSDDELAQVSGGAEDKDYFLGKLQLYNEVGERLNEALRELLESLDLNWPSGGFKGKRRL